MNINVGLTQAKELSFSTNHPYSLFGIPFPEGEHTAIASGNLITLDGILLAPPLDLSTDSRYPDSSFTLSSVTIGIGFHWQRNEPQQFKGNIRLEVHDGEILVINTLDIEQYLCSVISSEMSATNDLQLLKAHAVISRSWLLAQLQARQHRLNTTSCHKHDTDDTLLRWYDRDDHQFFDVCADDHCQRYQGITRVSSPLVSQAIEQTRHMVLTDDAGNVCDTRFSKCCGGQTETFETCWDDTPHPYLISLPDTDDTSKPDFCARADKATLRQVLNDYDQETHDFYRWTRQYSQHDLQRLLKRRYDIDFGDIIDLIPISRGPGGRIILLRIVGTKRQLNIGKELEIRKALSDTCLYSANFTVEKSENETVPSTFTLHGSGWGHGVGLCQIGAAQMAKEGYSFYQILQHYFPHTHLVTLDL